HDVQGCASDPTQTLDQVTVDGYTTHLVRAPGCAADPDRKFSAQLGPNDSFPQILKDQTPPIPITKLNYSNSPPSQLGNWIQLIGGFLPLLIFGGLLFFMMRQAQGSNNQALSFGKSRARMFTGNRPTVTFADVAGVEEAKQELAEVVDFLRYPEKFASLGARI